MENLAKALVQAQKSLHNLGKNAQGYGYQYLTLDKLIDETRGVLADNGLAIVQPMGVYEGQPTVKTVLLHESGESIEGEYPISPVTMKQCNNAQELGAAVTYARRYGLAAMLNIAQADDDAQSVGKGRTQNVPSTTIHDEAWDMFDKFKEGLTDKQRQWCMDSLNAGNSQDVIDKLKAKK